MEETDIIENAEYIAEEIEIKEINYSGKPRRAVRTELYDMLYDEDEIKLTNDAKLRRYISIVKTLDTTIALAATSQDMLQQNLFEIIKQIEAKPTTTETQAE